MGAGLNMRRLIAAGLVGGCTAYELHTMAVQERTRALGAEVNDTWSQITRDVFRVDTLVGKAVIEHGSAWLLDWYTHHLQES